MADERARPTIFDFQGDENFDIYCYFSALCRLASNITIGAFPLSAKLGIKTNESLCFGRKVRLCSIKFNRQFLFFLFFRSTQIHNPQLI
jgi:hypothetical protein